VDKTRDDLIDDVRYGRISPAQAEAEAMRLGYEPFAVTPDPKKFDPMREEWWTPVMALTWIAKRDSQAVREVFDPYRVECFDWHFREWRIGPDGPVNKGWFLDQRKPATISRFLLGRTPLLSTRTTWPFAFSARSSTAGARKVLKR
jgi:hypothetical protein